MDAVFKALADASRRKLLDSLNRRNGQTLRELCAELDMTRQAVTKHLSVLEAAGLVETVRRGREKFHHLNAAPINEIADRWIGRYDRERARALADLKQALEGTDVSETSFVYVSYIKTTPDRLWEALTSPAFIGRYFGGGGPRSDWTPGAPIEWKISADGEFHDWGQRVLEAEPGKRLSYTWHNYEREVADLFGWSDEKLAELRKEPTSKITFEIEPVGGATVKLTVTHEGLVAGSEMIKGVSEGWPGILSNLKTLLESGETLPID
ncbi:metalloregulator ArsR/SmtB family transcription factor [Streptosporangium oxazolinicum]|uniref:Metalloregulator ArsR/SmtB family transcription factor n=1 Tax=Streptosporangium oxazolinicum TaxID=909287 RepID=A0ABP8AXL7_9ACTN